MAKKLYWECPICGAGYDAYEGEIPCNDGICKTCGGKLVKTPYSFDEMLFDSSGEILNDIMNNYIKTNPQYNPEVYEMWKKRRDGKRTMADKAKEREQANKPKCPTCGSTNISKIGTLERGVSVSVFGLFSSKLGKTMKCNNCGYKW